MDWLMNAVRLKHSSTRERSPAQDAAGSTLEVLQKLLLMLIATQAAFFVGCSQSKITCGMLM
jgi:hypothetical protein